MAEAKSQRFAALRQPTVAEINALIDDPAVFGPLMEGTGVRYESTFIDMRGFYKNPGNIALTADGAIMLFTPLTEVTYDSHFLFPPACRGKRALTAARAMLNEMFVTYGAEFIEGHPPVTNRAVCMLGYHLGFRRTGRIKHDPFGRLCWQYSLDRETFEAASCQSAA